jgi:hypothetical protein
VPPASAVLVWSGTAQQLLAAATGCSRTSCYVHISLAAAAAAAAAATAAGHASGMQQVQEATVWLSPFAAMDLPPPQLQLSGFEFVAVDANLHLTRPSHSSQSSSSSNSSSSEPGEGGSPGEVAFTVSSSRVAAFAVWELTNREQQQLLPGHFSENAVTVHPCEPRVVRFVPHLGLSGWDAYIARVRQWQQQQQQQQQAGAVWGGMTAGAGSSSSGRGAVDEASIRTLLALLLQHSIAASSLYDQQRFEPSPSV